MALEIGHLSYVSDLPVSYAFSHGLLEDQDYTLVRGYQDELDAKMAAGKLAAGPVSSLEYVRNGDRYSLIREVSIGSWGRIGSSLLLSRVSFNRLSGQTVALPKHGATSNALTRWVLARLFGVQANYVIEEAPLTELMQRYPAALLIGDRAVIEGRQAEELNRLDMGEAWWQAMHTPFVHTVFVSQASLPRPERDRIAKLFQRAKEIGKERHAEVMAEATKQLGLPAEDVEAYFALLNYDLTPAHMQGLGLFADYLEASHEPGVRPRGTTGILSEP